MLTAQLSGSIPISCNILGKRLEYRNSRNQCLLFMLQLFMTAQPQESCMFWLWTLPCTSKTSQSTLSTLLSWGLLDFLWMNAPSTCPVLRRLQTILYMLQNMMLGYHGCVSWRICCQVRMCRSRLLLIRAYGIPTAPPMQTRKLQWRTIRATWRTRPLSPVSLHSLSEKMDSCHKTYRLFGWMVCYELTRKTELNIGLASGCYTAITCSSFSPLVTLIR